MRASRKVAPDYTVRWEGAIYRVQRKQIARGMRGARVLIERRLDGSRWMQWQNRFVALERCESRAQVPVERSPKPPTKLQRSAEERARAQTAVSRESSPLGRELRQTSESADLASHERFSAAKGRVSIETGKGRESTCKKLMNEACPI